MLFHPRLPVGVLKCQPGQPSLKVNALDAHQSIIFWIPQRTGFFIIKHKCTVIGPTRGHQGDIAAVDLAAVHSR